ncbi:MAG: hypothetical protein ACYCSH_05045 [Acidithiobacillus sp.]
MPVLQGMVCRAAVRGQASAILRKPMRGGLMVMGEVTLGGS